MTQSKRALTAGIGIVALLAMACGDDADSNTTSTTTMGSAGGGQGGELEVVERNLGADRRRRSGS